MQKKILLGLLLLSLIILLNASFAYATDGNMKEPLEKATFANLAVFTGNLSEYEKITSSIIRLLAPIIFTGLAALSVDTQKYCSGGYSASRSSNNFAWSTLFWISASTE